MKGQTPAVFFYEKGLGTEGHAGLADLAFHNMQPLTSQPIYHFVLYTASFKAGNCNSSI